MTSPDAEALRGNLAKMLVQLSGTEGHRLSVDEMRELYGLFSDNMAEPEEVTWSQVDADGVPAIWADPANGETDRVVQYVHGGGYVIGNAQDYKRAHRSHRERGRLSCAERGLPVGARTPAPGMGWM